MLLFEGPAIGSFVRNQVIQVPLTSFMQTATLHRAGPSRVWQKRVNSGQRSDGRVGPNKIRTVFPRVSGLRGLAK